MRVGVEDEKIVIGGNRNAWSARQLQRMLASTPTGEQKLRRLALWKDDIFKAPTRVTGRFGELRLDKGQRGIVPRAGVQMEWNSLGEINHDADD